MARSKTYKFVGRYQDHLRFVDTADTLDYLKPMEAEGALYLMWDYLNDYDRYRLLEWEQIDINVKFFNDWHNKSATINFEVSLLTNEEQYAKYLDELARAVGIAILDLEEDLYKQYQEELLNKNF